ncbi:DUF1016 N-terminal domain-containing protein, partial [Pontibacter toksunensis]
TELTNTYGRGWSKRHLWHCVRVADTFPEDLIVNALSTQLSWTHLRLLAAIEDELKRMFYTELSMQEQWSTRVLQERMDSMLFERSALSKKTRGTPPARTQHLAVIRSCDSWFGVQRPLCAGFPRFEQYLQ